MANVDGRRGASTEPIVPIDFSPADARKPGFSFRFKWLYAVVGAFLLVSGSAGWFVLTARSVFVEVTPVTAAIEIDGGFSLRMGRRYLIRSGSYQLLLRNEGYHDTLTELAVSDEQAQTHSFVMRKLPGLITVATPNLSGARVRIDGVDVGDTPLSRIAVEPGEHSMAISKERYLEHVETIMVEGRSVEQMYEAELAPAWAQVSLATTPAGAEVLVDGEPRGVTPLAVEILQGRRNLTLKLGGYKAWQDDFDVVAGEDFSVPPVALEQADGLVFVRSRPSGASVTIGGQYHGLTPLEVVLAPGRTHELTFFRNGYHSTRASVRTEPDQEREVTAVLEPVLASVAVIAEPADAELYVNGEYRGEANQTLELMAASQQIEIRKAGYVPFATEFTSRPGLDQEIRVTLKSLEQARLEQIKPVISTLAGQSLKLFRPGAFTMGASRREAGRRANETLRDVELQRPFYLGYQEVTNAEFRQFRSDHSSGTVQGLTLDNEAQPVVRISWTDAALYCNWLSAQEGLSPFYRTEPGPEGELVTGFNPDAVGYRLPTEAEWAWAARTDGSGSELRYPWGEQLPPPDKAGNFADVTVQAYLGEVLFDYNDSFFATAPVASFTPNHHELHDMAGNVSEWVHDYYGAAGSPGGAEIDPMGPELGQFHGIRGSSWAHGTVTELRLSYRDFGEEPRDDVGFRLARYLEPQPEAAQAAAN